MTLFSSLTMFGYRKADDQQSVSVLIKPTLYVCTLEIELLDYCNIDNDFLVNGVDIALYREDRHRYIIYSFLLSFFLIIFTFYFITL